MWYVKEFQKPSELQAFLRTGKGGGAFAAADILAVYHDAVSGRHVLVYFV